MVFWKTYKKHEKRKKTAAPGIFWKQGRNACLTALLVILSAAGCTPEDKTLLLPKVLSETEESESTDPAKDFSVKKIYAYTYETRNLLQKSAFLQGCGENEIHIIALDEKDENNEKLVYRNVDYRYGFYDTEGDFFHFWEEWLNPGTYTGEEMEGDLYIEGILPSPDGRQMLVYICSVFWDTHAVWLYTLGNQDARLLYEGILEQEHEYFLKGSFSPSGRWVTFDVAGVLTGDKHLVPVYDCTNNSFEEDNYWDIQSGGKLCRYYSPDELFCKDIEEDSFLLTAQLCDISPDEPGWLGVIRKDDHLAVRLNRRSEWESAAQGAALGAGQSAALNAAGAGVPSAIQSGAVGSSLHLLGTEAGENTENEEEKSDIGIEPVAGAHTEILLEGYEGQPFFQYKISGKNNRLFYMGNVFQLWSLDIGMGETGAETGWGSGGNIMTFPEIVWDFLPLESGDMLVLLAREAGSNAAYGGFTENEKIDELIGTEATPDNLQNYWDIRSADLYLYPADGSESVLLYKNVRNFLSMEYDAQTRRILLETYEEESLRQRRCIILEL